MNSILKFSLRATTCDQRVWQQFRIFWVKNIAAKRKTKPAANISPPSRTDPPREEFRILAINLIYWRTPIPGSPAPGWRKVLLSLAVSCSASRDNDTIPGNPGASESGHSHRGIIVSGIAESGPQMGDGSGILVRQIGERLTWTINFWDILGHIFRARNKLGEISFKAPLWLKGTLWIWNKRFKLWWNFSTYKSVHLLFGAKRAQNSFPIHNQ